jgi:molybdopterin molybdotransferase
VEDVCRLAARGAFERVALREALGRVPAQDVIAREDLVPFPRSAMDGYAVRASDTDGGRRALALLEGSIAAGSLADVELPPGRAVAVATGAPLPRGADAVVPFERSSRDNGSVLPDGPFAIGQHVFPPGDDARAGDVLAPAGEPLTAGGIGLLAAAGHASVTVRRAMRVAVFCTGDELVDVTREPLRGEVRNSNLYFLESALIEIGAQVVERRTLADDRSAIEAAIAAAAPAADLIVTTGGASVGDRDYVKDAFASLGARFAFHSVAMRPGRPAAFGTLQRCAFAVLPGNPSAVFVTFHELVRVCTGMFHGLRDPQLARVRARLSSELRSKPERTYFPFVRLSLRDGSFVADVADNQCSALTRNAAGSNALGVIPPGERVFRSGDTIEADVFDWSSMKESGTPRPTTSG